MNSLQTMNILLVEDNPGDVRLTEEAFRESNPERDINLEVVTDGEQALAYLKRIGQYTEARTPDIIFLDLNLPKKDGREVLANIKQDPALKMIPVVVLTTSEAEVDIAKSYDLYANCYITKPVDISKFIEVIRSIEHFWFRVVKLPSQIN
ncbi:MAG: response regulator [Bacteroidota bacterium]